MWKHIDLFSGYGGFAYAFREVFGEMGKTVLFCDNDRYCQGVLRKHWPEVPIYGDIRELIADTKKSLYRKETNKWRECITKGTEIREGYKSSCGTGTILTGGFPCQPFSHAGKRRGKSDNHFLWPEMLEYIRLFRPSWVIAENVYGILSIEKGMVFEQVCSDMEKEGYEAWPFIIPACAVNAPHRRDRIWIVAHKQCMGRRKRTRERIQFEEQVTERQNSCNSDRKRNAPDTKECGWSSERLRSGEEQKIPCNGISDKYENGDAPISTDKGLEGKINQEGQGSRFNREEWQRDWKEVAAATCVRGVDDGSSKELYGVSEAKHRTERLKMLGNGIVPQVAMMIMETIKKVSELNPSSNKEGER